MDAGGGGDGERSINALSAELRYPWVGTYTRQDGSRTDAPSARPIRDGSGILSWTIEAKRV